MNIEEELNRLMAEFEKAKRIDLTGPWQWLSKNAKEQDKRHLRICELQDKLNKANKEGL